MFQNVSPGSVDTEFRNNWLGKEMADKLKQVLNVSDTEMTRLQAKDISDGVIYVLSAPRHVTISELTIIPTNQPMI